MSVAAALPVRAQTILNPSAPSLSKTERLAVLTLSGSVLTKTQNQALTTALAEACREVSGFEMIAQSKVTAYLKKKKNFSVLVAEDAQTLCKNLALDYVLICTVESATPEEGTATGGNWLITLRWLEGSSGQMIKALSRAWAGDLDAPASLPLGEILLALLESPEIIVPIDEVSNEMPAALADSAETFMTPQDSMAWMIAPNQSRRGGRPWLWYITGAALVSGGSAILLLKKSPESAPAKTFLPQPPDPPK